MESIWLLTQHGDRAHRVNAEGTSLDEHQQLAGEHHRLRHIHLAHLGVMERREEGPAWLQWGEKLFSALLPTIWLTQTSRTLPMEVHLDVALCQQDAEPWLRLCVVAREPSSDVC
jgi:hypothetical protein